ncbi:MAG: hydroxymethylbilane synthase [candidate division Zixibacteria bacterium]|nr:hydroxymethylbilane synthase [candidate division Zixibacteria bacterium]
MIIGTRGSQLALYQSNLIKDLLAEMGVPAELRIIKTVGDKIDQLSFDKIEGKGFFTKELEEALLDTSIDLAVHSLKDLSTDQPSGLTIGAYCSPVDASELLLLQAEAYDPDLPLFLKKNAVVGTSSVRREAQLRYHRPDITVSGLRGNVPTRVRKLAEGQYDAIVIAKAGVERLQLDLGDLKTIPLDRTVFLPAPGQGILAIEIREDDQHVAGIIYRLNDSAAEQKARLERGLLARFEGGCQLPLAVTSDIVDGTYTLRAFLGHRDGSNWQTPTRYQGSDSSIERLIEDAYQKLHQAGLKSA